MAQGGPETDYARGRGGIPLPDLIAQAEVPPADPSQGLGPDMGMPPLMQDDTAGYAPSAAQLRKEDVNMNPVQPMDVGGKADITNNATGTRTGAGDTSGERGYRRPLQRAPWNEKYRYTQEDFYGSGNPNITFTDPRGVQMYVPQAGKLPMSIWASQMQAAQGQLAQTRKAMADLMEQSKAPETAPPFQRDFSRLLIGAQDRFIKGLSSQYGDDESLAMQEIATEGSQANRQWRTMNADAEALGQFVKYGWQDAQKWIQESIDGDIENYPAMRQHARELTYGIGSLRGQDATTGDFAKAAKAIGQLERDKNLSKYVREMVLPNAGAYYKEVEREVQEGINRGQRVLKTTLTEEVDKEFYDRIANEAIKLAPGLSKEYVMDYLKHVIPERRKDSETLQFQNLPQPSGGSGSSGAKPSASNVRMDLRPYFTGPAGVAAGREPTLYFTRFQTTGDKEHPVKEITVSDGKGPANIPLRDAALVYNPVVKSFFLTGTSLNETGKKLLEEKVNSFTYGAEEGDADYAEKAQREMDQIWKKHAVTKYVPADVNSSVVSTYFGSPDPFAATASIVGMPVDEYREAIKTKEGRERIAKGMGLPVKASAQTSAPAKKGTMTGASGL